MTTPILRRARAFSRLVASAAAALLLTYTATPADAQRAGSPASPLSLPAWTRGATCYEIFVRSFQDSDGDGIGDLKGLISRLDYINDGDPRTTGDLGARCIWLMPVAESPSYHGYDVTDYTAIERDYGTAADFRRLVAEAHRRGIRILPDLVLNHTSEEHPWFRAALRDTASPYRAWYRFSPAQPADPRGPWGAPAWHRSPVRDEWYYGVFWKGMPDLNYETPAVREEARRIARFWLDSMGVDGFRLDAVAYLMEDHGQLHASPGTHALLREFNEYVHAVKPDAYTVGEVNYGPILSYWPDQLDTYFAFELADSIVSGVRQGKASGILEPVLTLQRAVPAQRWAPFVRNHDQTRTRTEMRGSVAKSRLAAIVMLTMPGTMPFVYYGEEIGMTGDKPDERLRTPMQWSARAGGGFTTGKPWQRFADDSLTTTVDAQQRDPRSLLNTHRKLIRLRDATPALAAGALVPLTASDDAVLAYARREGDRVVVVVANLADRPLANVAVSADANSLPAGRWTARDLLNGGAAAPLTVSADGGASRWIPLPTLAPNEGYLLELRAAGSGIRVRKGE
jgi:glycosidase